MINFFYSKNFDGYLINEGDLIPEKIFSQLL